MHDIESRDQIIEDLSNRVDGLEAEVERLNGEVGLLKESTRRLPELLWKTARYTAICDLLIRPRGEDVVEMVECIKKEWHELRAHTWEQERAAVAAWIEKKIEHMHPIERLYIGDSYGLTLKRIKAGKHWPEGEDHG